MSCSPLVWVSTCHAVNGARPAVSSSGTQRDNGAVSGNRPSWARRATAVAVIGFVTDASRHTADVPSRGPSGGENASSRSTRSAPAIPSTTNGTDPVATWRAASSKAASKAWARIGANDTSAGEPGVRPRRPAPMPASIASRGPGRSHGPTVLSLVLSAVLVAACGAGPASSAVPPPTTPPPSPVVVAPPTPVLAGDGLLVTYFAHGGHCRTGTCEFTAEIFADGTRQPE